MKSNLSIVILIVVGLLLGVALLYRHGLAENQKKKDQATILQFSNDWVQTTGKLEEQTKVNETLMTNLAVRTEEVISFSNSFLQTSNALVKAQADAEVEIAKREVEITKREQKIVQLESERDELDKKMTGLNTSLTGLQTQIADTERKLAASEGDREFLLKELRRLQAEKSELEKQFNNLAVLRAQVSKLREELSIARRLEWIRQGLYGEPRKGGEILQSGFAATAPKTNYNLNVEIRQDGSVNVLPPPAEAPATPK